VARQRVSEKRKKRKPGKRHKRNVFSLDVKTTTESLLNKEDATDLSKWTKLTKDV